MATRTEWFKEFVRSLDKKAPYEDRKALALKALRTRYGQESSLLASEDRLLGGVFQHRAGKFPWGTSKKARTKSHKLASSSSLQEPLPADFRKREQANSRTSMPPTLSSGHSLPSGHNALPSGHNAVDAARLLIDLLDGPLLIDLLDVKEEEVHLVRRIRTTFW